MGKSLGNAIYLSDSEEEITRKVMSAVTDPNKKQLAANIIEELRPIREKRAYYEAHPEEVDKILMEGTEKARKVAKETMKKVKKAMMLDY